jgi:hypothetical protein
MLFTALEVALCTPDHVEKAPSLLPSPQDHGAFDVSLRTDHLQL